MTLKTLNSYKTAMANLKIIQHKAIIHMGPVKDSDTLVMTADFFLKLAEANWCIVSGVVNQKLIVIFRNAGFRRDAGKLAKRLFGEFGHAGGHRSAARAEIPVEDIADQIKKGGKYENFVMDRIKSNDPAAYFSKSY